jgi:RHS repeat-associated protein
LGNVTTQISDRKAGTLATNDIQADVLSYQQYYPFGWNMPGRSRNTDKARMDFNGKETDTEWGIQDYGFRLYDNRVVRFLSFDPLAPKYPWYSPYQFAGNNPIMFIDLDGLERALKKQSLQDAAAALEVVSYGALENNIRLRPNGGQWITGNSMIPNYYWKAIKLVGAKPSDGIKDIARRSRKYELDCASHAQVVFLMAAKIELGDDNFDETIIKEAKQNGDLNPGLILDYAHSSNIIQKRILEKNDNYKGSDVEFLKKGGKKEKYKSDKEMLIGIPEGSMITFETNVEDAGNYRYENVLKLNNDLYSAHPLKQVTYDELMQGLKDKTGGDYYVRSVDQLMYDDSSIEENNSTPKKE